MTPGGPAGAVPRGYRVAGWEVTELLGQGGWGTVYAARAVDPAGGRAPADVPDGGAAAGRPAGGRTGRARRHGADPAGRPRARPTGWRGAGRSSRRTAGGTRSR